MEHKGNENNEELFKMFEQAQALSKIFKGSENTDNVTSNTDAFNIDKLKQAYDMAQLFKALNESNKPEKPLASEKKDNTADTRDTRSSNNNFYDNEIITPELKAVKSAIPHLELKYQKSLGILVKLIEIQKLFELYGNKLYLMETHKDKDWKRNMLKSIRIHMTEEKKVKIDLMLTTLNLYELLLKMKEVNSHGHKEH